MKFFKRIWMFVFAIVLSVAMISGSVNLAAIAESATIMNGSKLFDGSIQQNVKLADDIVIPAPMSGVQIKVIAPNGADVTASITGNKLAAAQLGNYTITYTGNVDGRGEVSYSYKVNCAAAKEYQLYVADNGATIPTYAVSGSSFTVPSFTLREQDEDGNYVDVEGAVTEIEVVGAPAPVAGKINIPAASSSNVYVRLKARTANSNKWYFRDFRTIVQSNWSDTTAPKLSVKNMPETASVNTKVTLPKATATDDFDENVLVVIKVTYIDDAGNEVPVKQAKVNEYGYATGVTDKDVVFDNNNNLVFYPTAAKTYKVTYQAFDDKILDDGSYQSSGEPQTFYIDCVNDKRAPEIVELDSNKIPTKWGKTVINAEGMIDSQITIPFPTVVVDNATKSDDIELTITLRNAAKSKVVEFVGKVSDYAKGVTVNAKDSNKINRDLTFTKEGLLFSFDDIKDVDIGSWSVEYVAKDEAGVKSSASARTYVITLQNEFKDTAAPIVNSIDAVKYVVVKNDGKDEFVVPAVSASDEMDAHVDITYTLNNASGDSIVLDTMGETLKISSNGIVKGDKTLAISDTMTLKAVATDDARNVSEEVTTKVAFLIAGEQTINPNFDIDTEVVAKAGEEVNIGKFAIKNVKVEYTGFELRVVDPNGNDVNTESYVYFYENAIYVRDIRVTNTKVDGVYTLFVRAFDVTGKSVVNVFSFNVDKADSGDIIEINSAVMPSTGAANVGTAYKFEHTSVNNSAYVLVYTIKGKAYSVLGHEFTALDAGTYSIGYDAIKFSEIDAGDLTYLGKAQSCAPSILEVNASSTVQFSVDGTMPLYVSEKTISTETKNLTAAVSSTGAMYLKTSSGSYAWLVLPAIAAYNDTMDATVTVTAVNGNNGTVTVKPVYVASEFADGVAHSFDKIDGYIRMYAMSVENDGIYTVTVSAIANGKNVSDTYSIKVGDIDAPVFSIKADEITKTAKVGNKFKYASIEMDTLQRSDIKSIECRLVAPNKEEINKVSATSWSSFLSKMESNTDVVFDKTGDYIVEYTITDEAGNSAKQTYKITVSAKSAATSEALRVLQIILIVIGVLLIAAVVIHFVRFRKERK